MFSYYGSKSKIVRRYPAPQEGLIIEPFAGSARYALLYFDREVLLIDKYDRLINIWLWLQKASEGDILGLPDIPANLDTIKWLSDAERDFCGFQWNPSNQYPCNKIGQFRNRDAKYWQSVRAKTAKQLFKIRHWDIRVGDYSDAPPVKATWFIDPPYQKGGEKYKFGTKHLNFNHLRSWIEERQGQKIVCENSSATWMDFTPLVSIQGAKNTNTLECIWTGEFRSQQMCLFPDLNDFRYIHLPCPTKQN